MTPTTKDAYDLFHQGAKALAAIEANGIRINVKYLDDMIDTVGKRIKNLEEKLKECDEYKLQRRRYGAKTNLTSRQQLAHVLFTVQKRKVEEKTPKSGRPKMNDEVLDRINTKYTRGYRKLEKLRKLQSTYLKGVRKEVEGEYMHPFFGLHTTRSFRGSSSNPNFQNIPVRDPEYAKIIRSAFIARDGHQLVEIDFSALEFRIAACFWKDEKMVAYASDPKKDIHRDVAAECFGLRKLQVTKEIRYLGKNLFVFPQLYGDWYINCARNMWEAMQQQKLHVANGELLQSHLRNEGISRLGKLDPKENPPPGTFERRVKWVENKFNEWFPDYSRDKRLWWEEYCKTGSFRTMTGFVCSGVYSKNVVYNYPVQGPAFHALLWCLIRLQRWLKKNKMRSVIIAHIHDSIVADIYHDELEDYIAEAKRIMTEDIRKAWDWIITPLEVEVEVAPVGGSWHDKEKVG